MNAVSTCRDHLERIKNSVEHYNGVIIPQNASREGRMLRVRQASCVDSTKSKLSSVHDLSRCRNIQELWDRRLKLSLFTSSARDTLCSVGVENCEVEQNSI